MNDAAFMGFLTALGQELCGAVDQVVPHDGYEIWLAAFHTNPSPKRLAALGDEQLEQLRDTCQSYLEREDITLEQIRTWVRKTLWRWPADTSR